jgi:hypothetical protein
MGVFKEIACTLCKYHDACLVNTNEIFCVQVKNKPRVEYIIIIIIIFNWSYGQGTRNKRQEYGIRERQGKSSTAIKERKLPFSRKLDLGKRTFCHEV